MSANSILRNTQGPLQVTFYSGESGVWAQADVSVDITGLGGTAILVGGTATAGTAIGTGVYLYDLDPQASLDLLEVDWTGTFAGVAQTITTSVEVQGAFHVSIPEVRAMEGLSSTTRYPYSRLIEARSWWEDLSETYCGVAFVPRYGYDILDGTGKTHIMLRNLLPTLLRWVEIDGERVADLSDWVLYESGLVVRGDGGTFTAGYRNVVVAYERGYESPPSDIREAALVAIRHKLLGDNSGIPERAISMATEVGTFNLSLAGVNRPTGLPEVDSALMAHRMTAPLVG